MTKIHSTPTNTSNVCPEPEVAAPPKAEPGILETLVKNLKSPPSDIVDLVSGPLTGPLSPKELDSIVDVARDTKLGKVLPGLAVLDDMTDVLVKAQDYFVDQGKNPLDLLAGMPEAAERVVSRTNELIREVRGEDGIQLTLNPSEVDILKTAEVLASPVARVDYMVSLAAMTIETIAENEPTLKAITNSNTVEFLNEATDVAARLGDHLLVGALTGPIGAFVAAEVGFKPVSGLLGMGKDFLRTISSADNNRALFNLAAGPSGSSIAKLQSDETYKKELKFDVAAAAGEGVGYEVKFEAECKPVDGRYVVTYTMDQEVAAMLGVAKGGKESGVSLAAANKVVVGFSTDSPEAAARAMQGNPMGAIAAGVLDGIKLETLTNEGILRAKAEVGSLKFKEDFACEFDVTDPSITLGHSIEAKLSVGQEFLKVSKPNDPGIQSVSDLLSELSQPSLSGSVKVKGGYELNLNLDAPKFTAGIKTTMEKGDLKLEVELEVEVDVVKAAKALGITIHELKSQIDSGKLDPKSWWNALPEGTVELKAKVEGTQSRGIGIDADVISGKSVIERKSVFEYPASEGQATASEMLAQLRAEVTKGDLLNRPLRG